MGEEVIIYEPAVCNGCTYYLKPSKDEINLYREDGRLIRTFASESSIKYSAAQDSYYYILGQKLFVYHLENDEDVLIDELDFNDYSISLAIDDYLLLSLDHQPFLYDLNDHSIWEIQKKREERVHAFYLSNNLILLEYCTEGEEIYLYDCEKRTSDLLMSDRQCINHMVDVCMNGEDILALMDNGDIYYFQKTNDLATNFVLNDIYHSNTISVEETEFGYITAEYVDGCVQYILHAVNGDKKIVGTWENVNYVLVGSSFLAENDGKLVNSFTTQEELFILDLSDVVNMQ